MIYFFINVIMYLMMILFLCWYFKYKMNIYNFIIILFNLNSFFFFIYRDINFLYGFIFVILSIALYKLLSYFNHDKEDILLIKDGNINFHELVNHYSYSKLINYLKTRNIKLDEIKYCVLKNNQLVIVKNKGIKNLPISLIVDGNLIEDNLKLIHKTKEWLNKELLNQKLNLENINYAYYKNKHVYFING